jgi:hypothetical protein
MTDAADHCESDAVRSGEDLGPYPPRVGSLLQQSLQLPRLLETWQASGHFTFNALHTPRPAHDSNLAASVPAAVRGGNGPRWRREINIVFSHAAELIVGTLGLAHVIFTKSYRPILWHDEAIAPCLSL